LASGQAIQNNVFEETTAQEQLLELLEQEYPNMDLNKAYEDTYPISAAVIANNAKGVKTLLEYGADPSLKNSAELSAFDYAQKIGNQEIIAMLEQYRM